MEKEIKSQGQIIENLINRHLVNYCVLLDLPLNIKRITIIASGSSYNAGVFGKYFLEQIAKTPTNVEHASEFISSNFSEIDTETLYVFISQSGLSVDTVEAINKVKEAKAKTLAITNDVNSTIHTQADYKFYIDAGVENAIAATKTYSATVLMLWLIALKIAQNKHIDVSEETKDIYSIKSTIESAIYDTDNLDLCAKTLSQMDGFAICGLGYNYAISLETALKIRETSYVNTCAHPSGEFVHGHFAVLNNAKAFLTFVMDDASEYEIQTLNKILKTYKSTKSIVISNSYEDFGCDILVKFPKGQSKIANILGMIIVAQMLALNIAIKLKRDVDKPQGLVKIVNSKD